MKLSSRDLTGTGKVYRFTLLQMLKGKSNIITLVILFLITAAGIPVMTLLMDKDADNDTVQASTLENVYIQNDTGYNLDFNSIPQRNELFADTRFIDIKSMDPAGADWTEENYASQITPSDAYIHLEKDMEQMCLTVGAFTLEDKDFPDGDLDSCISILSAALDEARYDLPDAEPEQIAALTSPYEVHVQSVSEYLEDKDNNFGARFGIQMIYSMVLLILCSFSASFIIQKVIEEKASKLAELLMVSVSPLAMLLGKILAVMTYVFGLIASLAAAAGISYWITGLFADTGSLGSQIEGAVISPDMPKVSPAMIIVLLISLLLGYLQVSLISGLLGTGCSSTEDVEPANLAVVLLVMAGYLAATITIGLGDSPVLTYLVSLFPVTSMFCAPVRYIIGDIGIGMLAFSWAVQIAVIMLLAYVCARIYRALMMYRGSFMNPRRWITMFRQNSTKEVDRR